MFEQESIGSDVLVVGAGVAGMVAALEASRSGARVTLVNKTPLAKGSVSSRAGGFVRPGADPRPVNIPGYHSEPGDYLEDPGVIQAILAEAPRQIQSLRARGVPLEEGEGRFWRARGADQRGGGRALTQALTAVTKRTEGIRAVEGCSIVGLLKDDGRVVGAAGLTADGRWLSIYARTTVLATGGGAAIYHITSNPRTILGDGYVMALKAGATLSNLELIEFFPVGIFVSPTDYVHSGVDPLRKRNARLINGRGEDIVRKHWGISLPEAIGIVTLRFSWVGRAVGLELEEGPVFLDLTRLTARDWERIPPWNLRKLRKCPLDLRERPVPILPMAHTFHGGVLISPQGATSLEGLFAAGEVTGRQYAGERGANTLGLAVATGGIAGRNAAEAALKLAVPREDGAADEGLAEVQTLARKSGTIRPAEVRDEGRRLLYQHAGPIRSGPGLQAGLDKLQALADSVELIGCRSLGQVRDALELRSLFLMGEAVMRAALLRAESRGYHYRKDFPSPDDQLWRRPILVSYDGDAAGLKVEAAP